MLQSFFVALICFELNYVLGLKLLNEVALLSIYFLQTKQEVNLKAALRIFKDSI